MENIDIFLLCANRSFLFSNLQPLGLINDEKTDPNTRMSAVGQNAGSPNIIQYV